MRRMSAGLAGLMVVGTLGLAACANDAGGSGANAVASSCTSRTNVKIIVGGLSKQIYLPAKLTEILGYYAEQCLAVELLDEQTGQDAEAMLVAGQVDGVVGFYDHTIDLQSKGKLVESVVQFSQAPGEVELVRSDLADVIKSPADFKDRSLGVTGLGSSTNFLTKYLAVHNGVPVDQIHPLAVQAGDTFIAAMEHKQIDAGMTTEPTITRAVSSGLAKILVDMRTVEGSRAALGGTYPAACLYMQNSWVESHKDTAQKLANAYVKALKWISSHSGSEIADKLPADYYKGIGKDAYAKALDESKGMFTGDGVMPKEGPETVHKVLDAFSPTVQGKTIDLSKTFTSAFVANAK